MRVKLLANISGPEGNFKIGEDANLSEKLASALIKDGHAKEIVEKAMPENIKKLFSENPDLKQAFSETIDELSKPEHIEKMANDIQDVFKKISKVTDKTKKKR